MTDKTAPTVAFDKHGKPQGFLEHVDDFQTIRTESVDEGILVITLDRPAKLNAFDERMLRELRSVIWKANFDDTVRVIVITGSGRAFCSGRDINGLDYENNLLTAQYRAYVRANHELFDDLEAIEKPVIAAINGVCAAAASRWQSPAISAWRRKACSFCCWKFSSASFPLPAPPRA